MEKVTLILRDGGKGERELCFLRNFETLNITDI